MGRGWGQRKVEEGGQKVQTFNYKIKKKDTLQVNLSAFLQNKQKVLILFLTINGNKSVKKEKVLIFFCL